MHPPLKITADEITEEDLRHIAEHGYIRRPGGLACNTGYMTGDPLRRALCELALRGLRSGRIADTDAGGD